MAYNPEASFRWIYLVTETLHVCDSWILEKGGASKGEKVRFGGELCCYFQISLD